MDGKVKGSKGRARAGPTHGSRLRFLAQTAVWLTPLLAPRHPMAVLGQGKLGPGELNIMNVPPKYWREGGGEREWN